ncbi:MAG: CopD family protein [Nitrososphaerales archaeon]
MRLDFLGATNIIVLLSLSIIIVNLLPVLAHPFTVDTDPKGLAQLQQAPESVIIAYSEPVEEGFSTIKVLDSSGNRVDNDDTRYFQGDNTKLVVTLKPLKDDVYTVISRVLSQVDGHVVEYTYAFVVGNPNVPIPTAHITPTQPPVYLPETFSRFPGLVGQVIIVGISFASLFLWLPVKLANLNSSIAKIRTLVDRRYGKSLLIGVSLVITSGFAMIFVQASSLGVGIEDAIATSFGTTWLVRMLLAFVTLALYFALRAKRPIGKIHHATVLGVGLALLATTTMIGHPAATTKPIAIALDFLHNIVASVWIGGLMYLAFVAIPTIRQLGLAARHAIISLLIPRFSSMTVVALGAVAITGPLMLWMLEDNVNDLLLTSYGKLLISKLILAGFMIGVGAFNQFNIHSKAIALVRAGKGATQTDVHSRFDKSLKVESAIGIALLLSVALLANSSLPAGELPIKALATSAISDRTFNDNIQGFRQTQFTDGAIVNLSIAPARTGMNNFVVRITDDANDTIDDIKVVRIKLTNVREGIGPLTSTLSHIKGADFQGNTTFTMNGRWNVEVLVERVAALSITAVFDVTIKPELNELRFNIEEYTMPVAESLPLFPLYDNGNLWVSDTAKARIFKFDIAKKEFQQYNVQGNLTTILDLDSKGNVWFLDPVSRTFGYVEPASGLFKTYRTPYSGLPISLDIDFDDNVWIALLDTNTIVKFTPSSEMFETFTPPTADSHPSAIIVDDFGTVWFTEAAAGKIAMLDRKTSAIEEYTPATGPMAEPFALLIDDDRKIWIAEHLGPKITRFDPTLQTFISYSVLDKNALPFGMTSDRFGNVWFAQHVTDAIGVLNPHSGKMIEVPVPTQTSFVQWLATDDLGRIWFAEQRSSKIGSVTIAERPEGIPMEPTEVTKPLFEVRYADIVASGISLAIIASSLFYVKSVRDLRKSVRLVKRSVL